ncbi:MAG: hypothetical protein HC809_16510, partial [Gammaproteobacteria bacterium]|nr:hypothetical protein [Gammaproteobacteria bacterium]
MSLEHHTFRGPNGEPIEGATLMAHNGTAATFIDRGATLTKLYVADRNGRVDDVVLGFDVPARYFDPHPHIGCIVGRCANRIRHSRFTLDGQRFELTPTHPPHHLHGGPNGFHTHQWRMRLDQHRNAVEFRIVSPDGDEGYPGTVEACATYAFDGNSTLRLDIEANCDRPTPINLTAHHYFNLAGAQSVADVGEHRVEI